ncbi:MAG: DNA translocase SpoIIIE [bacterium ADurb.Bin374]|nr:MAG: DNA translocase SpoIIIE [bacterium ADurb.Bin374]
MSEAEHESERQKLFDMAARAKKLGLRVNAGHGITYWNVHDLVGLPGLEEFNIKAEIIAVVEGPAVSRFELKPGPGVKSAKILSVANDIAMSLAASIRIEAPIPGKSAIGIEIPNAKPTPVFFYDLMKNENFRAKHTILNLALGKTISNQPVFANLADMPHLLIAGQTGAGKSVCINTIIASILYQARPDQVKMVMIDPKRVELSSYNGIPHLMAPVVTDPKKASAALLWAIEEMMRRYELMETCGVRNIASYNEDLPRLRDSINPDLEPLPYLVLIVDELADLMMTASAEVEGSICRLAQMARAVGIHLVIATQRPSVDVLTGIIKANLPTRIAFAVASQIDSRTILDGKGAESLLGKGDMLFAFKGQKPLRIQGAYISDRELQALTDFVRSQGTPEYIDITPTKADDDDDEDEPQEDEAGSDGDSGLMAQIRTYLATQDKTSTSMLQRKFKIGYNRAARIMDLLEEKGMVSPLDGSNKRRVLRKE